MVTMDSVEKQLKDINFNQHGWGRSEVKELPNILVEDEEIFEVANGIYEGGFALLVGTNHRVLLIDKKPMNYLTVEDLRFDMINQIDYSHRLLGARINIATGSKNLRFTSYNQQRLRNLITHVQHCMAEAKSQANEHQEDQKLHLERINQQLQAYLIAQYQQQEDLKKQLEKSNEVKARQAELPPAIKPSPELADYLFAQSLLAKHGKSATKISIPAEQLPAPKSAEQLPESAEASTAYGDTSSEMADLYAEGMHEIFGKREQKDAADKAIKSAGAKTASATPPPRISHPLEINPLRVAYSKLPMALRNRKFGRPSFHAHSQNLRKETGPADAR
jgi:hypothetical protein